MQARINPFVVAPAVMHGMLQLDKMIKESGLEISLIELIKIRTSQINGCAYCLHMHTHDARMHGESEERLYLLNAWHESTLYSPRERAALGWAEDLTHISKTHAPDSGYETLKNEFNDEEIVKLTLLITTINAWNRIAVGFRSVHPRDRQTNHP